MYIPSCRSMGGTLALAPPFPLSSRHAENILRVCSQRRPQIYDTTSVEKEPEMFVPLRKIGGRFNANGPVKLPEPVPDIDLLACDETSSTLLMAELKWIRKPCARQQSGEAPRMWSRASASSRKSGTF